MKRFYECTFIINPGMDDSQTDATVKQAEDTIVKNGGEIISTEQVGRRRLAYPILKKHNGFYVTIEFEAEGHTVEKIERFLTLDENVMRYLTVKLDKRELEAKRERLAFTLQSREQDKPQDGENGDAKAKAVETADDEDEKVKAEEKNDE